MATDKECRPQLGAALDEAKQLICGDRRDDYGNVEDSFADVATMWSVLFGIEIQSDQVALAMILLKVCREKVRRKHDNRVDIAGYAALADVLED